MEPIVFKYKNYKGEISERRVLPKRVYFGSTEHHPHPQLLMEAFDMEKNAIRTFALRDIIHDPLPKEKIRLGDRVRFIPQFKFQRMLEGIVCYIEEERIFFFSGIMPAEFYGTDMAKRPGRNLEHNGKMYTWELMCHHIDTLEKI